MYMHVSKCDNDKNKNKRGSTFLVCDSKLQLKVRWGYTGSHRHNHPWVFQIMLQCVWLGSLCTSSRLPCCGTCGKTRGVLFKDVLSQFIVVTSIILQIQEVAIFGPYSRPRYSYLLIIHRRSLSLPPKPKSFHCDVLLKPDGNLHSFFKIAFVLQVLGFELRTLHLLGRHSTTSVRPPAPLKSFFFF
jgi:hypothetical protein